MPVTTIEMKTLQAGPSGIRERGSIHNVPKDISFKEAKALIEGGCAVEVAEVQPDVPVEPKTQPDENQDGGGDSGNDPGSGDKFIGDIPDELTAYQHLKKFVKENNIAVKSQTKPDLWAGIKTDSRWPNEG